nr:MAG TPA: hypothetical protein [Bacteriophage sp.]
MCMQKGKQRMVRRQAYGLKTFGFCLWVRFPPT